MNLLLAANAGKGALARQVKPKKANVPANLESVHHSAGRHAFVVVFRRKTENRIGH
jgi:hypothetical protein